MNQPESYYITTPIYYVNAEPHIGNAYTTIAADVLKRYLQLFGYSTFFLTGTDEHGSKVAESAEKQGLTPQEFCDRNSRIFKESWKSLNIEYDKFIRTTDPEHEAIVRKFIQKLHDKNYIYQGEYRGLYCIGCEKFITEKELTEEGLCRDHLTRPQQVVEKNYFFRLSEFLEPLKRKIESGELKIVPEMRRREVLGLFKQDLMDFSLSREKVKWGVSLPFDHKQVTYVWVDALINYISACGYPDHQDFERLWNRSYIIHLMAKDILKFHCIFWPAMLMAAEVRLPDKIVIHGYLNLDSQKISKTLGNIIRPADMIAWFGIDASRFLILNMCAFGSDGDIRIEDFYTKYNSDLANNYGNLVSRTLKMIDRNLQGKLPAPETAGGAEIIKAGHATIESVKEKLIDVQIKAAADDIILYLNKLNVYFDENKPWMLAKDGKREELAQVLYNTACGIAIASCLLSPFLTRKSALVLAALFGKKIDPRIILKDSGPAPAFADPIKPLEENLFPRLEMPGEIKPAITPIVEENLITIEDFAKVELRVALVTAAERVPKADKLLKLQIEIEGSPRQIVAGIAEYYSPEQLVGKKIVVVANLKPAKLRGIESQGMLLAAKKDQILTLLTVDADIPSGAKIS